MVRKSISFERKKNFLELYKETAWYSFSLKRESARKSLVILARNKLKYSKFTYGQDILRSLEKVWQEGKDEELKAVE